MKNRLSFLLLVSALISCSESEMEDAGKSISREAIATAEQMNHVSNGDVLALTQAQSKTTRAKSESYTEIECITSKSSDTLLYVVNKQGGGWTIYSTDTRVPAIVAQSDEGSYEELMKNEHAMIWIQTMAEDMGVIKGLTDKQLNFTEEEIENNKAFWKSVSAPDAFAKEQLLKNKTKGRGHPIIDNPDPFLVPIGHYELVYSEVTGVVHDSIARLTTTDWHQDPCHFGSIF